MAGWARPGGIRAALLAVLDPATGAWGGLPFGLPGDQGRDQVRAEAVEGEVTPLPRRQPPRQEVDTYVAGVCRFYRSDSAGLRPRNAADEAQDDVAVDRADDLLGQRPVGEVAPGKARQRLGHRRGARIRPPSRHPGAPRRWVVGGPRTSGRSAPTARSYPELAACMRGHGRSVGQAAGTAVSLAVSTSTQDGDVVAARRILRAHSPCHEVPPGAEITPGVAPDERGPGATDPSSGRPAGTPIDVLLQEAPCDHHALD